jgi:hypothetical protein
MQAAQVRVVPGRFAPRAFRFVVGALLLAATARARAEGLRLGVEAGAGLAHELAGIDITLRYGHVGLFIPFGVFGFANVFDDGAPTAAGGLRFFSGDGEGVTLTLQGATVWTPDRQSAEDAGLRAAVAVALGGRARLGDWFLQLGAGPVVNYDHGWSWGSMHHRRNWYRDWPVDLDAAIGFEF